MTQFRSRSSKRVVAISPISFGLVNISVPRWVTLLSVSIIYLSHYLSHYQSQNRKGCKADPLLKSQGSRHKDIVDCTIVVVSLHVDEQLYQAIWLLDYWIGCSDGPKLRYLAKNVKISKFFYVPDEYFFSKKIFRNILKVVFYTF